MTLKLICTTALKTSLDELLPQFEAGLGHKVDVSYGPSAQLGPRIAGGEPADAIVLTDAGIDEMIRAGKVVAGSRLVLATSQTMVAVKQGTPRPDVSTPERFKQALLAAKSVAYSRPGSGVSGAHIAKLIEQLGIADALRGKSVLGPGGPQGLIGSYLVRGEAEIGMQQDSELMAVPGVDIVGPLPPEFALTTSFVFGIHSSTSEPNAGRTLGDLMRSPAAHAVMKAKGLTPA
jgi:molybdate transport system substrate-binding protein